MIKMRKMDTPSLVMGGENNGASEGQCDNTYQLYNTHAP